MHRFQYTITTKATPDLAWDVFSNCRAWHCFANIYGELRWREGKPWGIGSHLEIEVRRPVATVVDHLITDCVPGEKVAWIDRAMGITIDQQVEFEQQGPQQTRVHTFGKVVHSCGLIGGRTVEQLVTSFTETWYENFRLACNQLAAMSD